MELNYTYGKSVFQQTYEITSESDGGVSIHDKTFEERHEGGRDKQRP